MNQESTAKFSDVRTAFWDSKSPEERKQIMSAAHRATSVAAALRRQQRLRKQLNETNARVEAMRSEFPELVKLYEARLEAA